MEIPADTLTSRIKANWLNLSLAALAFAPLLWNFFILSWSRPAYQFFPMALLAAGMLASRGAQQAGKAAAPGSLAVTRWLVLATVVLCLVANARWSPWLGFIAFLMGAITAIWGLGGKPLLKALVPAIVILLAILPPPMGLDEKLTLWLRSVAVHISCALLDALHIILVQDGNTIQLPGKTLFVEEACSGINSFILCNVFCLFWFLWQRRPLSWVLVALPSISVCVVLGNILRITICSAVYNRWRLDLLEGWRHETFGLVLLMGYCILALSLDQLFVFLLYPAGRSLPGDKARPPLVLPPPANQLATAGVAPTPALGFKFAGVVLFLMMAGVCCAQLLRHGRHALAPLPTILTIQELQLTLPASLAGWDRDTTMDGNLDLLQTTGVHTTSWLFRRGGEEATVAVDYPLGGYHDVRLCYEATGWHVDSEEALAQPGTHEDLYTEKLVLAQAISHAEVLHADMDQRGNWISKQRWFAGDYLNAAGMNTYRVQLIVGGYAQVAGPRDAQVQDLFFQARTLLARQITDQLRKTGGK